MTTGGRVAIVEVVLGGLTDPGWGALIDMSMVAVSPGQERSLEEYDDRLAAPAGGAQRCWPQPPHKASSMPSRRETRGLRIVRLRMVGQKDQTARRPNDGSLSQLRRSAV
ncbi:MAG: hypothetical protein JWR37_845 [Mycobacterium sp.]|nr:hypothetical protein [Mycobacterium sp.]